MALIRPSTKAANSAAFKFDTSVFGKKYAVIVMANV